MPSAWKTIFGWAILGPFKQPENSKPIKATVNINQHHQVNDANELLTRFWETEKVPNSPKQVFTPEEEQPQEHFLATHQYLASQGRYCVTLPRKPDAPSLGNSRPQAVQRYLSNEHAILKSKPGNNSKQWFKNTSILATPNESQRHPWS